ncbi:MAG: LysR family transcriptional regulator [Desulfobacteraceae bacterium]|nr:LysR family transcriptional regulator [Desulfobacteraceae bacterium]MBU4052852.1 LysR family transcriptional regulator [Pseudomonadota bacterium]
MLDITFEQMNAFHAVASCGSFSRAGKKIFRTQSAVSIQIAKMEDALNEKLFHRTTKSVELTDAGKVMHGYVTKIKTLLEEAEQELMDMGKLERGRLVLSTSDTTACYRLPAILQSYKGKYPGIEILVRNSTSLKTIEMVMQNEVDMGIATLADISPEMEAIPLFPRQDVVICHPDHALARRKEVFLKDLEQYECVLLDRNCSSRRILDEFCKAAKVNLKIAMELSSIEVIKNFVAVDAGISIVPEVAVQKEQKTGELHLLTLKDFQKGEEKKMGVIYRKNRYLSLAARKFLEELRESL